MENPDRLLSPTATVLSLVQPVENSKRNITADNYFTSIELVDKLQERQLTYVGTIRQNKRDLPEQFKPNRHRPIHSSTFGFTRNQTLVSYVPKKNRSVTLLSTLHHDQKINETNENKPEIIEYYNLTKGGDDALNQKCATFTVGRRSRRWPQVIWFAVLNIAGVNAHVILNSVDLHNRIDRQPFLKTFGFELIRPNLVRRSQINTLPRELSLSIKKYVSRVEERPNDGEARPRQEHQHPPAQPVQRPGAAQPPGPKRRRCCLCPRNTDRKHPLGYAVCHLGVCRDHSTTRVVCNSCNEH